MWLILVDVLIVLGMCGIVIIVELEKSFFFSFESVLLKLSVKLFLDFLKCLRVVLGKSYKE